MVDPLSTESNLLARIRNHQDHSAWTRFVEVYAPVIYRFARKYGLQDSDAADVTQEVLQAIAVSAEGFVYDRERGKFRSWLFTVVRHRLSNFLRAGTNRQEVTSPFEGDGNVVVDGEDDPWPKLWDQEHNDHLYKLAAKQVRASVTAQTWEAFWKTTIEQLPAQQVAKELNLSVGAVYVAKSRIIAKLRHEVDSIERDNHL